MHMNTTIQEHRTWSTTHRISAEDKTAMSAMRVVVEPNKGRDIELDVWEGMVHGFLGGVGRFAASTEALEISGAFLTRCFAVSAVRR
jgi:hypothetical protein